MRSPFPGVRWSNPSLPQTLGIAVFLLYAEAVLLVLDGGTRWSIGWVLIVTHVVAAVGIANERRWGYSLGCAAATMSLLPYIDLWIRIGRVVSVVGFLFAVARFVLLVHPQSREHQRTNFT